MVEVIWPLSVAPPTCRPNTSGVLSLRRYIEETLRRSRTSYSTLQVALYYLVLIMPLVPKTDFTREQLSDSPSMRSLQCGRRMFLAALILASKYLQDRNYSAKAWSKMSGLKVAEINMNERAFLESVNWKLHIPDHIFKRWTDVVLRFAPSQFPPPPQHATPTQSCWREVIPLLTPELDIVPGAAMPVMASPQTVPVQAPFASLPSFLEPELEVTPPTPVFVGALPTPRATPPRMYTPAVSVASVESWPAVGRATLSRRTSMMSSGSSRNSSPESSVSDVSRLSRSSSISSVSTSATSLSSQSSISAQSSLGKYATCRNMEAAASGQPMVVNECITASPLSFLCSDNRAFPAEDAQPQRASRAAKRTFSERDDEVEGEPMSILQRNVRSTLRQGGTRSMPMIIEDDVPSRSGGCGVQYEAHQMLASGSRPRKQRCLSVAAH